MIQLEAVSQRTPKGAANMLQELGTGGSGFGGTQYGSGEIGLAEYLLRTMDETNAKNLPEGRVPQTTSWIVKDDHSVGMLRMRHELNDHTRIEGGHIGYYIHSSARRKGYATKALSSALKEIALLGVIDVMLTTTPENTASIRVIERNGGILKAQVSHPNGRDTINQYRIALP